MAQSAIEAVVQKLMDGRHGPYAVATADGFDGSITFALTEDVWTEDNRPEPGVYVLLSDLQKKRGGWRAKKGRFLTPADTTKTN